MQVVRLKNELASGICCSRGIDAKPAGGVGTLSRAAEVPWGHGLAQVPFWFAFIRVVQAFRGAISGLPSLPFCSRQAHSFLHLAMERDAARSCSFLVFFPQ